MTYPNVLVLQYLKKTGQLMPETQMKAENFIAEGYQRLLTFEVPGGGFSWFGNPPALVGMTAFGLMEFNDMAQVYEVDPAVIERTAAWVRQQQQGYGSWGDSLTTAYVTWALAEIGQGNTPEVQTALSALRNNWRAERDPYVLSLIANAMATMNDPTAQEVLRELDGMKITQGESVHWEGQQRTLVGTESVTTGSMETTALVVHAMLRAGAYPQTARAGLTYLIGKKDAFGTWQSTQATVLALKAFILAAAEPGGAAEPGQVTVSVDGMAQAPIYITPENADALYSVVFDDVSLGDHSVAFQVQGGGNLMYQVTTDYYLPWHEAPPETGAGEMDITVDYDRTRLAVNDVITARAQITLRRNAPAVLALVDLGVPPGFSVEASDLERLVESGVIQRFELTGRQIILYIENLRPNYPLQVTYRLRARFPIKAKAPASVAYDYYSPEGAETEAPVDFVVE